MASSTRASRIAAEQALGAITDANLDTARQLFAVANALQQSAQLRSLLSDPSAETAGKEHIVRKAFGAKLSESTLKLVIALVGLRWSATRDLPKAAESLGVRVIAQLAKDLDGLQGELFQIQQLVSSDQDLELALSSNRASSEQKQSLLESLLSGRVSESAALLASQAVSSRAVKRYASVLDSYGNALAQVAGESVANIRVARPLSDAQLTKLSEALKANFGRALQLNVEIAPEVVGGVHVAVNGEVIDATVLTKLTQARLQL